MYSRGRSWPRAGKMVVTRSARPQARIQATTAESSGQKVGNSKPPSFLLAASQNGAEAGGAAQVSRGASGGAAERAGACRALLRPRSRAKPVALSSLHTTVF